MVRLVGSNTPELTDVTAQNYAKVQQNMLTNFESASTALAAEAEVTNADYQTRITEWQNKEKRKQMEAEGGGGGLLGDIAELGKQLVAGYVVMDELEQRKKAQKAQDEYQQFQISRQKQSDQLDREKFEYSVEADKQNRADSIAAAEAKAQGEKVESDLDTAQNMVIAHFESTKLGLSKVIKEYGAAVGSTKLNEVVASIKDSQYYNILTPERQSEVIKLVNTWAAEYGLDTAEAIYKEQQNLIEEQFSLVHTQWQNTNATKLLAIKNGVGVLSQEQVNTYVQEIVGNWDTLFQKDEYKHLLTNKNGAIKAKTQILKEVGVALQAYYGDVIEGDTAAARLIQATNQIALLEADWQQGKKSDLEFTTEANVILQQSGIGGTYNDLPTSLPNRMSAQSRLLENIEKQQQLSNRNTANARVLGDQTPEGKKLKNYNIGKYIYDNLDNLDRAIGELEGMEESRANLINRPALVKLMKQLPEDRSKYLKLHEDQLKIQAEMQKLEYNPNRRPYIFGQDSGSPLGLSPDGTPLGQSAGGQVEAGTISYREGDSPIPNTSPEHMATLKEQIAVLRKQQIDIVNHWLGYGIDIANPANPTYLDKMGAETKALQDLVDQKSREQGVSPQSSLPSSNIGSSPAARATPNSSSDLSKRVVDAVYQEFRSKDYQTLKDSLSGTLTESIPNKDDLKVFESNYIKYANAVMHKALAGDIEGAKGIIEEAKKGISFSTPMTDAQITELDSSLMSVYKRVQNKKNWYRNKLGEQSRSNSPPSFTSGSQRQEVKGALATVDNEDNVAPAAHLKGNLASHPDLGWTPFKGGTVTLTSPYKSKNRPNHRGIDLDSTDPRVASIQGGTVKWAGSWKGSGYGNVVFIETRDGHIEMYAHLENVGVKQGQVLQPGDVVGKMGGTGDSPNQYATHLHMEVWTNTNWKHPSEGAGNRGEVSPIDYLQQFKGKVSLPTGTGTRGSNPVSMGDEQWVYSDTQMSYKTGAIKLASGLVYFKGEVVDPATGKSRLATVAEGKAALTGTPETAYRTVRERKRVYNESGQMVSEYFEIPEKAMNEGTYLFLTPTGKVDGKGNDVWYLEGYYQNRRMFQKPVLNPPMGDGDYLVTNGYGYSPFANPDHKGSVDDFVQRHTKSGRKVRMYVRRKPTQRLLSQSGNSGYKVGVLDARGDLSIAKVGYKSGGGTDDFGYQPLRMDAKLNYVVHQAARDLNVPAVWVADQLDKESNWKLEDGKYLQIGGSDRYQQIQESFVAYHEEIQEKVGGYRNYEEMLMGMFGGSDGVNLLRNDPRSSRSLSDGQETWTEYLAGVGKRQGRKYRFTTQEGGSRIQNLHDVASDGCPVCNAMTRAGSFNTHIYA